MILEDLLERTGGITSRKGSEVMLDCPFCSERGVVPGHNTATLGINTRQGIGHCFRCEWKSRSFRFTVKELCRILGIQYSLRDRREEPQRIEEKPVIEEPVESGLPQEYERFTWGDDPIEKLARQYLNTRGVSRLQILRHNIGYAVTGNLAWRILFPVYGDGKKIYGVVGRTFHKDGKPKYLNTPGLKLLWNAHRQGSTAVVTEGVMDALSVERALYSKRDWVAVARLGNTMTELQMRQLKNYEQVIILPDHDAAGIHGAKELANRCTDMGIGVSVSIPRVNDGRDPGSMTEDEIREDIMGATKWNGKITEWKLRLSATRTVERN